MEAVGIKLAAAVLCEDCETITEGRNHRCELCTSTALLSLAVILNRAAGPCSDAREVLGKTGVA